MILYSNKERWFLNIRSKNNRIIVSDNLFFNFNRCSYFYFYGRMIFKPLILREINISSKRFAEKSYYLRVKSIFSAKLTENIGIHKRFQTIKLRSHTRLLTFVEVPIFKVAFNSIQQIPSEFNSLHHKRASTRSIEHGAIVIRKPSIKTLNNYFSRELMIGA